MVHDSSRRFQGSSGMIMLELVFSMVLLTIGVLGLVNTFHATHRAQRDIIKTDLVSTLFANAVDTLENANFSTLYQTYNGHAIALVTGTVSSSTQVADLGVLKDPSGNPAQVTVSFYVDETKLPSQFGPVLDLDGDGTLKTVDCSTSYILLPTRLRLLYQGNAGTETRDMFLILMNR